jgi:hypothetical protein
MSIIKLLFKKNVIEEVVVPSPTTFYATAMKKFQDVIASSIVPAMTTAKLVFTELSNTLIITTSNKVTTTVEYARDVASSIESRMQDYYSSSSAAEVVVPLIKEQQKILLLLTVVLSVALSFTILPILSNSISQKKKKKKNESVRVVKKIHSMVTIDTTATSSSSSSSISNSNSSVNKSSTCTTQEDDDADADNDNGDGVWFIDDMIPMIPSLFFHDIAEPNNDDNNGSSLVSLKRPTSCPMRKLSKKLSSNKMFKMSVKKNNNLGSTLRWNSKNEI